MSELKILACLVSATATHPPFVECPILKKLPNEMRTSSHLHSVPEALRGFVVLHSELKERLEGNPFHKIESWFQMVVDKLVHIELCSEFDCPYESEVQLFADWQVTIVPPAVAQGETV